MRNKSQTHVGNVWRLLVTMAVMLLPVTAFSQEVKNRHTVEGHRYLTEYWGQPELYLQHQAYYMLDLADKALNENPPQANVNLDREMALLMIDAVTHEPAPKDNPAVKDFLAKRMNRVIEDLSKPIKNKKGLRVSLMSTSKAILSSCRHSASGMTVRLLNDSLVQAAKTIKKNRTIMNAEL